MGPDLGVLLALLGAVGLIGLMVVPLLTTLGAVLLGISTGAGVIFGLEFISLRAAVGPQLAGLLHDKIGYWTLSRAGCAVLALSLSALGYMAGRARQLPVRA